MARKIEMTWRCSACGRQNLGRFKVCQGCGDPKDASERYEMPSDTAAAPTVTDPTLLRMANAGPDWRCAYCGSDQRRSDDCCARCGAPSREGASVRAIGTGPSGVLEGRTAFGGFALPTFQGGSGGGTTSGVPGLDALAREQGTAASRLRRHAFAFAIVGVSIAFWGCIAGGAYLDWRAHRPRDAVVARVAWTRDVHVDRYHVFEREGFSEQLPREAFDVREIGPRHHHDEQILDHYETESYTEQVQDGYDTETYTVEVSCGEDCTSDPPSCHEVCSSDDNGFASCHDVCSGGGRSCTTRYCTETRTRQTPRYRTEYRTREVPRYRYEPRYATAFAYRVWDWGEDRVLHAEGHATRDLAWPSDARIHLGVGLAEGERERERRVETFQVVLRDEDGREYALAPASEAEFLRWPLDAHRRVRIDSSGRPVPVEVTRARP